MMKNSFTGIEDQVLVFLYKNILLKWELHLKDSKSSFKVPSKEFREKLKQLNLRFLPQDNSQKLDQEIKKNNFLSGKNPENIFIFITGKKSMIPSIFGHLRNSIAHARFKKIQINGDEYLLFEDYYKTMLTMTGQLKMEDLSPFIEVLLSTRITN